MLSSIRQTSCLAHRRVALERTHAEADVTVSGPAADLLLVISRRRPLDAAPALELQGDHALVHHWIEHMDWVTDVDCPSGAWRSSPSGPCKIPRRLPPVVTVVGPPEIGP